MSLSKTTNSRQLQSVILYLTLTLDCTKLDFNIAKSHLAMLSVNTVYRLVSQ